MLDSTVQQSEWAIYIYPLFFRWVRRTSSLHSGLEERARLTELLYFFSWVLCLLAGSLYSENRVHVGNLCSEDGLLWSSWYSDEVSQGWSESAFQPSNANSPNSFISNQGDSLASATFFHLYLRGSEMKGGGCFLKPQSKSSTVSSMHFLCVSESLSRSGQALCLQPGLAFRTRLMDSHEAQGRHPGAAKWLSARVTDWLPHRRAHYKSELTPGSCGEQPSATLQQWPESQESGPDLTKAAAIYFLLLEV